MSINSRGAGEGERTKKPQIICANVVGERMDGDAHSHVLPSSRRVVALSSNQSQGQPDGGGYNDNRYGDDLACTKSERNGWMAAMLVYGVHSMVVKARDVGMIMMYAKGIR